VAFLLGDLCYVRTRVALLCVLVVEEAHYNDYGLPMTVQLIVTAHCRGDKSLCAQ
jgi:hypothetical protein